MKKMYIIIVVIAVVVVALFLILGKGNDSPKIDITKENKESLSQKITVGKTTQSEIAALFGEPKSKFGEVRNFQPPAGQMYLADQRWLYEQRKDPLVFVSLDIYFNPSGVVTGFELKDNH